MPTLKLGSKGDDVVKLQKRLNELGFNSGTADGDFGPRTKRAVIEFQRKRGLDADGIVGPRTREALGSAPETKTETVAESSANPTETVAGVSAIPSVTVAIVSKMFPQTPRANIEKNLPFILTALAEIGLADKNMVLMALATIRAETESFRPIDEGISKFNTAPGGKPFALYDNRGKGDLGNLGPPDGANFKGRGYVQLTGRFNYTTIGGDIGVDLVSNPARANDPATAANILAFFLKRREGKIRDALKAGDLKQARKLVNGGSHGLDRFTDAFRIGEKLL